MLKIPKMGETQYSHLQQASGTVVDILATTGVQQGDQAAMLLWNLALHPVLCRVKHSKQLLQGSPGPWREIITLLRQVIHKHDQPGMPS